MPMTAFNQQFSTVFCGQKDSLEELIANRTEEVSRMIAMGAEYQGHSALSLICNIEPVDGMTEIQIEEELKKNLLIIMYNQSSMSFVNAAARIGDLLVAQVKPQMRKAVELDSNRILKNMREAS